MEQLGQNAESQVNFPSRHVGIHWMETENSIQFVQAEPTILKGTVTDQFLMVTLLFFLL